MTNARLADKRARTFVLVSVGLVVAAIVHLFIVLVAYPSAIYWLSYYVPNYEFGFVRRGLGGEVIRQLSGSHYFPAIYTMMWAPVVIWLGALGVLMWRIISGGVRSDRRIMLALLVPVLPFSLSYALYSPRPELYGMTALLAFCLLLGRLEKRSSKLVLSACYGIAIAVLALVHEAIPLLLALGAVLAVVVLSKASPPATQRLCSLLAVGPGVAATLLVAVLGRKDLGAQLCAQIPHRLLENPYAASTSLQNAVDYILGRVESKADYHDWMCHFATPMLDATADDGLRLVGEFGLVPLVVSFVVGLLYFAGTTWAIHYLSGVPISVFIDQLRDRVALPLLGLALVVPVFMSGVDWTRWWIVITFDVAIVYIVFATARPEIDRAASRRNISVFVWLVAVLAVVPTGAALHFGGPGL